MSTPAQRPNPFMALKAGRKLVVIAVVDVGSISFFRFGEGAFTEWPMI
jgi:tRNA-splicing endonuclease subunit Sen54